ncbi:hypothetical protein V8B97DRAFT_1967462 [Scleroderma yunnanense]
MAWQPKDKLLLTTPCPRDVPKKTCLTFSTSITSASLARKYLLQHSLLPPNQDPEHHLLSQALLNLMFTTPGMSATTTEVIRLIAILLDDTSSAPLHVTSPPAHVVALGTHIELLTSVIQELRDAVSLNNTSATTLSETIDETKKDLCNSTQDLVSTAKKLAACTRGTHTPMPNQLS